MKFVKRYWGWIAVALLVLVWSNQKFGPVAPLVLSVLATLYFLFQVPVSCGALNRDGTRCRNNSSGLLMGCRRVRIHKWLKLSELVDPKRWREFNRALWLGTKKCVAAGVSLAAIASGVAAVIGLFLKN
jgi:hypothetical protein